MVSRRNFCSNHNAYGNHPLFVSGSESGKGKLNHYEKNAYAAEKEDLEDGSGAFGTENASGEKNITGSRGTIVYIGEARSILWGRLSVNGAGI